MFKFFIAIVLIAAAAADCPANTVQWPRTSPSKCFTFVDAEVTFDDAEKACQANGGHLTSVHEGFTNSFLSIEAASRFHYYDFWLGGKSYGSEGYWNWTDGTSTNFTEWERVPVGSSFCVSFNIDDGHWKSQHCVNKKRPYVCKNDETVTTGATTKPTKPCDDEWFYFEETNSCYYWADNSDWESAENFCKSLGSHLMSIHSSSEANFTKSIYNGNFWIGLYSNSNPVDWNSTWIYTDGSTVDYTNWGNYQSHDNSRCVQIFNYDNGYGYQSYFRNLNCSIVTYGICKKASIKVLQSTSPAPVTSTTQASPYCINGWLYNANTSSCYTLTPRVNWTQAGEYCRFNNAHLTSFHDQNELNFFSTFQYTQNANVQYTWNGLYSTDKGMTWKFTDGSDFNYRPWNQGYPRRNGNNCGYYDVSFGNLQNNDCGTQYYGICKRAALYN